MLQATQKGREGSQGVMSARAICTLCGSRTSTYFGHLSPRGRGGVGASTLPVCACKCSQDPATSNAWNDLVKGILTQPSPTLGRGKPMHAT
jgi:hypothetical protein